MTDDVSTQTALGDVAARQLANATKSVPMMEQITPRWLPRCLQWLPVEAGVFRLNKVRDTSGVKVDCSSADERELPEMFVNYEEKPREYNLCAVTTVVDVHTRVSDLYSVPHNQIAPAAPPDHRGDQGAAGKRADQQCRVRPYRQHRPRASGSATRTGAPTPDDLDELITKVWKEPGFFLAHPAAIAAFGRECTRRGVPPPTVNMYRLAVHHLARHPAGALQQDQPSPTASRRSC